MKEPTTRVELLDDWLRDSSAVLRFVPQASEAEYIRDSSLKAQEQNPNVESETFKDTMPYGYVIDIQKQSKGLEMSQGKALSSKTLESTIAQVRTVWRSKKRVIWLSQLDHDLLEHFQYASSKTEYKNLQTFHERHVQRERHFFDSAIAASNQWETEIHLSFFSIFESSQMKPDQAIYELDKHIFVTSTTMSLRFSGDFADRHWTCYFLKHRREEITPVDLARHLKNDLDSSIQDLVDLFGDQLVSRKAESNDPQSSESPHWQQRRVLELMFLSVMLKQLQKDTLEILRIFKRQALCSDNLTEKLQIIKTNLRPPKKKLPSCRDLENLTILSWFSSGENMIRCLKLSKRVLQTTCKGSKNGIVERPIAKNNSHAGQIETSESTVPQY